MGKERKTRSDAGVIMATRRDLFCITWIAEQYAARGDQIRRLLSRFPDPKRPFKDKLIAETTVRDQIARWKRAGWIEYQRFLADEPGFAWVTRRGLHLVGLEGIYVARAPAPIRLDHIYAINQLRLNWEQGYSWKSERRFRSELNATKLKDVAIPDALVTTDDGLFAAEVEITSKKPAETEAKIRRLLRQSAHPLDGTYGRAFPSIAFFVPNQKIKGMIEGIILSLRADEIERLSLTVVPSLLPSRFRPKPARSGSS